jgi:hypothetical protein
MSTRILLGVKAAVLKGDDLITFVVTKVKKIRSLNLPNPQEPVQACSGKTLTYLLTCFDLCKVIIREVNTKAHD